jgi:hypothetical protein
MRAPISLIALFCLVLMTWCAQALAQEDASPARRPQGAFQPKPAASVQFELDDETEETDDEQEARVEQQEGDNDDEASSDGGGIDGGNPFRRKQPLAPPAELQFSPEEANLDVEHDLQPPEEAVSGDTKSFAVQPASGQAAGADSAASGAAAVGAPKPAGTAAATMLEQWLRSPPQRALTGRPIPLLDALKNTADRGRQLAAVKAYWAVSHSMADYHLALADSQWLASLSRPSDARELAALEAAAAVAEAHERQAELAAIAAQHDLATIAGLTDAADAPLAADAPFVGSYGTKFQALFGGRPAPESVRRIDQTLPLAQRLIEARAGAVTALESSLKAQVEAYHQGQVELGAVLAAHAALRQERNALLKATFDYNGSIADYALFVATPGLDRSLVVKMLIVDTRTQSVLRRRGDQSLAKEQSAAPAARTGRVEPRPAQPSRESAPSAGGQFRPKRQ